MEIKVKNFNGNYIHVKQCVYPYAELRMEKSKIINFNNAYYLSYAK